MAWDRLHPRLTRRAAWIEHPAELPLIEGTVIRLQVEHVPGGGNPQASVWLWWSGIGASAADVDRLWHAFLRRFDLEHIPPVQADPRLDGPKIRAPETVDRWTWLILAVHTRVRLARGLSQDLRRPWEKPTDMHRLTLARVRRGFRHIRSKTPSPARPTHPGPGRPPGSTNRPAPRHEVGLVLVTDEGCKRPAHHKRETKPPRVD